MHMNTIHRKYHPPAKLPYYSKSSSRVAVRTPSRLQPASPQSATNFRSQNRVFFCWCTPSRSRAPTAWPDLGRSATRQIARPFVGWFPSPRFEAFLPLPFAREAGFGGAWAVLALEGTGAPHTDVGIVRCTGWIDSLMGWAVLPEGCFRGEADRRLMAMASQRRRVWIICQ